MEVLKYKRSLISIIKSSASLMDKRIVEHGERVSYIMYCLLQLENRSEKEINDVCMLSLLHDIGAYKTDEVDRMMQFETLGTFDHSVYGYEFLKFCNVLEDYAEAVLYHHTNYDLLDKYDCENKDLADKLHLADRIDVLLQHKDANVTESIIQSQSGKYFSKYNIDLFIKANKKFNILNNIKNMEYKNFVSEYINNVDFSKDEIEKYLQMVMCFIDFRSEDTVAHTLTIVKITREISKLIGLSKEQLDTILWGAFFHDIGKLAIPLNIIEKKGKLTFEEFEIMKTHVILTREILSGCINSEIVEIAARHHEKINGSGYPLGLTGDDLTIEQRIVAVADILSALIGKRSYKGSFDKDRIISIISSMVEENQICPRVSKCVIENYDFIVEMCMVKSKKKLLDYYEFTSEVNILLRKFC